jgi:hypothetical protein
MCSLLDKKCYCLVLLFGAFSFYFCLGATVTFQAGDGGQYSTTNDTTISSGNPTNNYSSLEGLFVDEDNGELGGINKVLIQFPDIIGFNPGQIPPQATVHSAILEVTCFDGGWEAIVCQILEKWEVNEVCWDRRDAVNSWSAAGCEGGARKDIPDFTFTPTAGKIQLDITSSVRSWVNNPETNYGVIMMNGANGSDYRSSEYSVVEERPKLIVEFTPLSASKQSWGKVKEMFK